MDAIEQRLTTDVSWAQAVVDLGDVARHVAFDGGRPVSLVRIGLVVDALSRYLVDGGAMLYGVAGRELLSESALTSKERMVLGRWADDGLIEITQRLDDRVPEVAELTGLPLIALHPVPTELTQRYPWLRGGSGRVLRVTCHNGAAALNPLDHTVVDLSTPTRPVAARVRVPEPAGPVVAPATGEHSDEPVATVDADPAGDGGLESGTATGSEPAAKAGATTAPPAVPLPMEVFFKSGAARIIRTHIARNRFIRADPSRDGAFLLSRQWRCDGIDCPAFGQYRRIGQPVPRIRQGTPVCPRHGEPVVDIGPRPAAYPVSIVVDDLPRRRLLVREGQPLRIGCGADDPDVISVAPWVHKAAEAWISPVHVHLEVQDGGVVVTDVSRNGTVLWQRNGPDDPGTSKWLRQKSHRLGDWDSIELYTGIGVNWSDRRFAAWLGRDEVASVLRDAPTAAHHQLQDREP